MQQEPIQNNNKEQCVDNEEQIIKKNKLNIEKPKEIPLSKDILGIVFKFLSTNEQLQLRLVVQQFNTVVQEKLQQLLSVNYYRGSFKEFEKFISQFECLRQLALPSIMSIEDQPIGKQLNKIKIDDSLLTEDQESIYFQTFFEKFQPTSLSLCKFRFLKHIPQQYRFEQIKELDLLKVMTLKDKQILCEFQQLKSFAAHFHQSDPFFQTPDFPDWKYLKMLKIRLEGPNIVENQIENFKNFIDKIKNLEVLELHYYTYHSTQAKQAVFNEFLSLPKLKVLMALNSLKEIENHQFTKILDYIIIDNNSQLETQDLSTQVLDTLLAFSNIIDLTNCRFGEEQQKSIQKYIEKKQESSIQSNKKIKVSFEHQLIQTNYEKYLIDKKNDEIEKQPIDQKNDVVEKYPIVQRNDVIKTLWGTKHYNLN